VKLSVRATRILLAAVVALAAVAAAANAFSRSLIPSEVDGHITYVKDYGGTRGRVMLLLVDDEWLEADRSAVGGLSKGSTIATTRWSTTLETSEGTRTLRPATEVWVLLGVALAGPAAMWWGSRPTVNRCRVRSRSAPARRRDG
jgi:hypothetical protein